MSRFLGRFDDFFASSGGRFWIWLGLLTYLFLHGLSYQKSIMGWPSPDVWLNTIDSDVYIRLTKVRELLQGGSLYDHTVAATNAPYHGADTPWTHPLNFILIFLYQFSPSDFPIEKRLLLVANWYPLIIITMIILFMQKAVDTGFKSFQKFGVLILCLISTAIFNTHNYFMTGNTDHHSIQALLWCLTLFLVLTKTSARSALGLGIVFGLWFWISPESLPFILITYVVLGIKSIMRPDLSYASLLTSLGVLAVTVAALFIEYPPHLLLSAIYDANSIVYVTLFAFSAIGFSALHSPLFSDKPQKTKLLISAGIAAALSGIYLAIFPKFLKGPMADTDAYITEHFLKTISEATPFYKLDADMLVGTLYLTIPALLLAIRYTKKSPLLFIYLFSTAIMWTFQNRWNFYLQICSIVIIAKFLPSYIRAIRQKYKYSQLLHPFALVLLFLALIQIIFIVLPEPDPSTTIRISPCKIEAFQTRQSGSLVMALGNGPLTVESNALGNSGMSFFTPYRYIAGNYHREGKAIQVKDTIFDSPDIESIRPLLKERGVNALLICPTVQPSWVNEYFGDTPPNHDWVKINTNLKFSQYSPIIQHPVLLNIYP